jgi:energy-coupling factor transporter ATP-binding protein EcfA2
MHGSVGILNGKALLFIGPSGRGKSTILRILRRDIMPFADDAFAIRRIGTNYYCFQTSSLDKQIWVQKSFQGYPIQGLFLLQQSKKTYLNQEGIVNSSILLLEEIISNPPSVASFTKQFFSFIKSRPSLYTFFFSRNRRLVFDIIKNVG